MTRISRRSFTVAVVASALNLSACGGGGGNVEKAQRTVGVFTSLNALPLYMAIDSGIFETARPGRADGHRTGLRIQFCRNVFRLPTRSPDRRRSRARARHVFQAVTDQARHEQLYVDIFGFRVSDHIDLASGRVGTFLHCNPRHHSIAFAPTAGQPLLGHLMVEVESVNDVGVAYGKVLAGAARLTQTFGRHSNDKMISFYCKSPSNLSIEFGTGGEIVDDATWTPTRYDTPHFWGHNRERL